MDEIKRQMERIEKILDADYRSDGTVDAVIASLKRAICEAPLKQKSKEKQDK